MKVFKKGQKVFAVLEYRQVLECTVVSLVPGTPVYIINIDTNNTAEVALTGSQLFSSELKAWEFIEAYLNNQIQSANNKKAAIDLEISNLEVKLVGVNNKLTVLRPATGVSLDFAKVAKPARAKKLKILTLDTPKEGSAK